MNEIRDLIYSSRCYELFSIDYLIRYLTELLVWKRIID
ncbi:hypothetical protein Tsp_09754 [Trichinella spiralis]|nr:hypothetical protein Tsp_09754 [Trichinella spiralis]